MTFNVLCALIKLVTHSLINFADFSALLMPPDCIYLSMRRLTADEKVRGCFAVPVMQASVVCSVNLNSLYLTSTPLTCRQTP